MRSDLPIGESDLPIGESAPPNPIEQIKDKHIFFAIYFQCSKVVEVGSYMYLSYFCIFFVVAQPRGRRTGQPRNENTLQSGKKRFGIEGGCRVNPTLAVNCGN